MTEDTSVLRGQTTEKQCVHLIHLGKRAYQINLLALCTRDHSTSPGKKDRPHSNATFFSKPSPNSLAKGAPSFTLSQSYAYMPLLPVKTSITISQLLRQFSHSLAECLWVTGCNHPSIHSCGCWWASDPLCYWPGTSIPCHAGYSTGSS